MLSLVIPIFKNEENIPSLIKAVAKLETQIEAPFEAVFVVDGSPDESFLRLREALPNASFDSQLIALSRNFGAFSAIRAGLEVAKGDTFAVMAADLQEPPELIVEMQKILSEGEFDVVFGERIKRKDPLLSRLFSIVFWWFYRRNVTPDIPRGGVDIFGCSRAVCNQILALEERNSSLVGLLFWVGFKRKAIPYERRGREIGKSSWTLLKKWKYMQDSVFSFSDLPISILLTVGLIGTVMSACFAVVVVISSLMGQIEVPGYAATIIAILFFGALQMLSVGVLGVYTWRVFENTKGRPSYIIMSSENYSKQADTHADLQKTEVPT